MEGEEDRDGITDEKRESPIPMKIQQVLEKFQERLSEKDDQISSLQKQIETLQNGAHYIKKPKSAPQRIAARPLRDAPPQASSASAFTSARRVFRPTGRPPPSTSTYINKGKSRSMPSSPSKKITIPPKAAVSRPHSRQAASAAEQASSSGPKLPATKSFVERNKQRFRTVNGTSKIVEKNKETKNLKLLKNDKQTLLNGTRPVLPSNGKEASSSQQVKNGNNQSSKNIDSGSSYSADSRASSAADFVSVSGSPSPGLSIDGSNHTDGSCPPFLEDDALSYIELTNRLKRMTEEHDKLQAEHSRVLALLADKRREEKHSVLDITDLSITESSALISDRNHLEMIESSSENTLASTDSDQLFSEQKMQSEATIKEFCKQEVLRLREELLALQKYKTDLEKKLDESNSEVKELLKEKERLQQREIEMLSEAEAMLEKFTALEEECQTKELKMTDLEKEIEMLQKQCHLQQQQLDLKEQHVLEYQRQLREKSILLQEMEKEANEMKEFMQAERSTLSEALAEAEAELETYRCQVRHLQVQLEVKLQNLQELQTSEEAHRLENLHLKDELDNVTKLSQEMLKQDIQLTRIKASFHQLIQNLQIIINYVAYHIDPHVSNKIKNEFNDSANDVEPNSYEYDSVRTLNQEEPIYNNPPHASFVQETSNDRESPDSSIDTILPQSMYSQMNSSLEKFEMEEAFTFDVIWNNDISKIGSDESLADSSNNNLDNIEMGKTPQDRLLNMGDCEYLLKQMHRAQKLISCLGCLLKDLVAQHQKRCALAEENSERMQKELKRQLCLSEGKIKKLQDEMDLLHSNEKRIHQDLKKAINKQNETQRAFQLSQNKYTQLTNEFESLTDQHREINLMKDQIHELQKVKKTLEMEKKLNAEQLAEAMNKICQLKSTGPSEADGFSIAESLSEKYKLKNEVQRLTLQVLEKENEIAKYKTKYLKHQEILHSNWNLADEEVKQMDTVFSHVLETLRTIPEIVGSCEPLHKLWLELEDDESRTKT